MTGPAIGSLFSGYGGLELGVQAVLGGHVAWHVENDPAATRVLAHRYPGVPNHGDVTTVEWTEVEPVDVVTLGFPCQDISLSGRRAGLRPGTRSGLWSPAAYAVGRLRPHLVVIENVRGLLSADAVCDLEPCPWCMGDGQDRLLRGVGAVLGDLAGLRFDARWCGLQAADVGAPHARSRIFLAAWPTGADLAAFRRRAARWDDGVRAEGLVPVAAADAERGELQRRRVGPVVDGAAGPGEGEGDQRQRRRHTAGDGGEDASDPDRLGPVRPGGARRGRGGSADDGLVAADAAGDGWDEGWPEPARLGGGPDAAIGGAVLAWGEYEPAIRRWELATGRSAPVPTEPGKKSGQRLSPRFVEWMQGLPDGWVTDVPGVTRNEQLRILGNGVVPQQCAAAVSWLLDQEWE